MPTCCYVCPCFNDEYYDCQATGKDLCDIPIDSRYSDCPLIEVPPHGRLIDADAVERNLVKMQMAQKGVVGHGIRKSRAVVRDMATVIPADNQGGDAK